MEQNQILLFLRKALIAFPFLIGSFLLVIPQLALSAAIEKAEFTIDPFPLQPIESETLFVDVIETGSCGLMLVHFNQLKIDTVNKQIKISLQLAPAPGVCSNRNFRVKVIENLPSNGEYMIAVYNEPGGATSFFNDKKLLGSFNLSIAEKPIDENAVNNIPTLSEWMLILMTLILLSFAAYEIKEKSK